MAGPNSGRYLFEGLSNLGQGIRMRREREEREAEMLKEEAREFKELAQAGETLGWWTRDEATTKSLPELRGVAKGKQLMTAIGEDNLRRKKLELEIAGAERDAAGESSLVKAMQDAGTGSMSLPSPSAPGLFPNMQAQVRQPVTRQSLIEAFRQNPQAANTPLGMNLLSNAMAQEDITPVLRNVGGRQLIVNPKSGAFQDVTPAAAAQIPEGFVALGATMDESGKLDVRYGPPKAEGKALSQEEVNRIASLNQAEMDLDTLQQLYSGLPASYGGPVSGRIKSMAMAGQNPNIAALENAITAATPNLARGVFREVGVLTDADVERYKKLLPSPYDTDEVRKRKVEQLRDRIAKGRKEMVASLKAAGRDVEGFAPAGVSGVARYDSEAAARSAGAKAGDVIELYDPQTATYRKAKLK